jgi:hypothetical protein
VTYANKLCFAFAGALCAATVWRISQALDLPATFAPPSPPTALNETQRQDHELNFRKWPRSLFSQTNPATTGSPDITGTTDQVKSPKLIGIIFDGKRRLAVISYGGSLFRVEERQTVGTWAVVRIDPHSAILEAHQGAIRLRLDPTSGLD